MASVVRCRIWIEASPQRVFDLLTDPARFPEWKRGVIAVQTVRGRLDEPGGSYTALMRVPGRTMVGHFEIAEVQAPYRLEQRGTLPTGTTVSTDELQPAGNGTRLTFQLLYTLPGGWIASVLDAIALNRVMRREMKRSLETLKRLAESD